MRKLIIVFIACLVGVALTTVLVLNDCLLWIPVFLAVLAGQWWLSLGGKWRK